MSWTNSTRLGEHVTKALAMSGSKQRYSGEVEGYDQAGTTIHIISNGRRYFAFPDKKHPVRRGDRVTFRICGQFSAIEVRKEEVTE